MKNADILELKTEDLLERIEEAESEISRMKINHAISPLENPLMIRSTRREIARLKTEITRRQAEGDNNSNE